MLINPSKLMFLFTLISGTLMSISSSTWMGMWMGLEMNLLSFIPLMNKYNTPYETESSMKYFLVQAIASVVFLMSVLISGMMMFETKMSGEYLISLALLMKMGAAPLHFWFPGVMEGLDWLNCFILMTWQKIAPFILISYKMTMNNLFIMTILMSTLIGSVGGLNQNSVRKLMAYSSISHLGWMMSAMLISKSMWSIYFLIYSLMNFAMIYLFHKQSMFYLSQSYYMKNNKPLIKFSMFISMLSLAGLPPFLGFLPKWLVIQNMIYQGHYLIMIFMVMTTLMTLFFYMRVMFSSFLFMNQEIMWENLNSTGSFMLSPIMISIIGIPITIWMFLY
uniref:NADH-ubiquinone oxidoreductase chain 2 n=1 Tax=Cordulia aenea TaxID=197156 RepID=A0A059PBB7_9ODON|nr:NADH dehydrogenase subunit 2 [Cordulia aenea]